MTTHESADDHDALSCPQCQAATQACAIIGPVAEAMQRMIDDGTFERMGREMAMRQEEAFWRAFLAGARP